MKLIWDKTGERLYETGVKKGVLYVQDGAGAYPVGVAWNGLIGIEENPTGAEPSPQYADDTKYLNLMSAEEFEGTIEAFTYPDAFAACDGSKELAVGVTVGQQGRKTFGLAYRTTLGNDVDDISHGYKIHLVYGALASPSSKSYQTINDTPEAITLSWDITTTPVEIPGFKSSATLVFNSTTADPIKLAALEEILYGKDATTDPVAEAVVARLPLPTEILTMFAAG